MNTSTYDIDMRSQVLLKLILAGVIPHLLIIELSLHE